MYRYTAATPQVLALLTSGLTASLALEQSGNVPLPAVSAQRGGGGVGGGGVTGGKKKMVALVTAAVGLHSLPGRRVRLVAWTWTVLAVMEHTGCGCHQLDVF